jgi:hypothetical protein
MRFASRLWLSALPILFVPSLAAQRVTAEFGPAHRIEPSVRSSVSPRSLVALRGCAGGGTFLLMWVEQTYNFTPLGQQYLDSSVLFFQPLTSDGVPLRAAQILRSVVDHPTYPGPPSCSYDGMNFLIAWEEYEIGPFNPQTYRRDDIGRVFASRVSATGQILPGSPFLIFTVDDPWNPVVLPRLVWNGDYHFLETMDYLHQTEFRRITTDGRVADSQPLQIAGFPDSDPVLGWDGTEFVALARRYRKPECLYESCFYQWDYTVSRVDRNLALLGTPQKILASGWEQYALEVPPAEVAAATGFVIAAWQASPYDTFGPFVSYYSAMQISPRLPDDQNRYLGARAAATPHIAWNGDAFIVTAASDVRVFWPGGGLSEFLHIPADSVRESIPLAMEPGRALIVYEVTDGFYRRIEWRFMTLTPVRHRVAR